MTDALHTIGEFLHTLRVMRRLSLRQLAERATLSKRTLLYWESGTYQPSLPELQAALLALDASPAERLHSLALLNTPRAHAVGRRILTAPLTANGHTKELGDLPSGGDLLRSLRYRRGFLLGQVAAQMRVSNSTISRWESGKTIPPTDRLRELLLFLGARPAEADALQQGYLFLRTPLQEVVASPEELQAGFDAFTNATYSHREDSLNDLHFLSFEAQAWRLAARSERGEQILAAVCADYASYLSGFDRFAEAGRYASRVLATRESLHDGLSEGSQIRAAIIAARALVYRSSPLSTSTSQLADQGDRKLGVGVEAGQITHPERGLAMLQKWQPLAQSPAFHAWILSDRAEYLALQKKWEAAIHLRREACEIAAQCDNPDELRLRQLDLAKLEVRVGAAGRALTRVHLKPTDSPFRRADIELFFAEASLALGKIGEAQSWFERGQADVVQHGLLHLRRRAQGIAVRLRY